MYNLNTINPGENNRNERRIDDLNGTEESDRVSAPLNGIIATLTIKPVNDYKALVVRVGRLMTTYEFNFTNSETDNNGSTIGSLKTNIIERYTVYPLSVGAAFSSPKQELQFFGEIIYALGSLNEEYTLTASSGGTTKFSHSYNGTELGYQLGVIVNPKFGSTVGLHLEGGYRGLRFYEFEENKTNIVIPLNLTLSSFYCNLGLSFIL